MDRSGVQVLIFDVFGTVVDWRSGVAAHVGAWFGERGIDVDAFAFAEAWRDRYDPAMKRIRDGGRGYVALDILHMENLEETLQAFGLDGHVDDEGRAELNRAWERLPPWPDSVAGLTALKTRHAIATCSNGSIALMLRLARYGGLPWDALLGAEIARSYKPRPEVYLASVTALGCTPDQVMMVAAHNSDLAAAQAVGLRTAFVPRPEEMGPGQTKDLEATGPWDVVAGDLVDLARRLGACRRAGLLTPTASGGGQAWCTRGRPPRSPHRCGRPWRPRRSGRRSGCPSACCCGRAPTARRAPGSAT